MRERRSAGTLVSLLVVVLVMGASGRSAAADDSLMWWAPADTHIDGLFEQYPGAFGLVDEDTMEELDVVIFSGDLDAYKYQQHHYGIPVMGAELTVYVRGGYAVAAVGRPVRELAARPLPLRSEASAFDVARAATLSRSFRYSDLGEPRPTGRVVWTFAATDQQRTVPVLAYRFVIDTTDRIAKHVIDVDGYNLSVVRHTRADSADLAAELAMAQATMAVPPDDAVWAPAKAKGMSLYNGEVELDAETAYTVEDGSNYRLRNGGPLPVRTFDMDSGNDLMVDRADLIVNQAICDGNPVEVCGVHGCVGDFGEDCSESDVLQAAVSAHWGAQRTLQYFLDKHGRIGVDNQGTPATLLVNRDVTYGGTQAAGAQATSHYDQFYSDEYAVSFKGPGPGFRHVVALDVVAHELAHAVSRTSISPLGLEHAGQSGALSEGLSDIFAMMVEAEVDGAPSWGIADQIFSPPDCMRNIKNPGSGDGYPNNPNPADAGSGCQNEMFPNTYDGANYKSALSCPPERPNCDIHTNATVPDYWFYLMTEGCGPPLTCVNSASPPDAYFIEKIDRTIAADIVYKTMTTGLTSVASFQSARDASIVVASLLHGPYSKETRAVTNAWYAVNVGDPYSEPATTPADGDVDVEPWPAELKFDVGPTYDAGHPCLQTFEVYVADNAQMNGKKLATVDVVTENLTLRGVAKVPLRPNRTYYWQIHDPLGLDCSAMSSGREVRSFTTKKKFSLPITPSRTQPCVALDRTQTIGKCHPWGLVFAWQSTTGAERYRGTVATDTNFSGPSVVDTWDVEETSVQRNVLVDRPHFWQVYPRGPKTIFGEEENDGEVRNADFVSSLPRTYELLPNAWEVYPWSVTHAWQPVVAADGYDFRLYAELESAPEILYVDQPETNSTSIELALRSNYDHRDYYRFEVDIHGPPMPCLDGARESGETFVSTPYSVDGYDTIPDILSLSSGGPHPDCLPAMTPVSIEWTNVTNAVGYELTFTEAVCPLNQTCTRGIVAARVTHPHDDATPTQGVPVDGVSGMPKGGKDVIGYFVDVLALGPDGLKSHEDDSALYWVQPPAPTVHGPPNGTDVYYDTPLEVSWSTPMAHGGGFIWEYHDNGDCTDFEESFVVYGKSGGYTKAEATGFGLTWPIFVGTKSWRVKPFVYDGCNQSPHWSECRSFVVHESSQPDPTDEDDQNTVTCNEVCYNWCPNGGCPNWCSGECVELCLCAIFNDAAFEDGKFANIPPNCCLQIGTEPMVNDNGYDDCRCPLGSD